jgi:hypothetical protein
LVFGAFHLSLKNKALVRKTGKTVTVEIEIFKCGYLPFLDHADKHFETVCFLCGIEIVFMENRVQNGEIFFLDFGMFEVLHSHRGFLYKIRSLLHMDEEVGKRDKRHHQHHEEKVEKSPVLHLIHRCVQIKKTQQSVCKVQLRFHPSEHHLGKLIDLHCVRPMADKEVEAEFVFVNFLLQQILHRRIFFKVVRVDLAHNETVGVLLDQKPHRVVGLAEQGLL